MWRLTSSFGGRVENAGAAPRSHGRLQWFVLVSIAAAILMSIGSLTALGFISGERPVPQPLAYSHHAHVIKHEMTCVQCHVGAESTARATIPNIESCSQICHRTDLPALSNSPVEFELREYLSAGENIPWQKVYRVDSHVYFSHARHTVLGEIACETCHGNVGEMTTPVQTQARVITMSDCMACHEERQVSNDCNNCHR